MKLHGYTMQEVTPHVHAMHGIVIDNSELVSETLHDLLHDAGGCSHEHYRTETGARALEVKES